MQTLIINGSPHKKGDTYALITELSNNLHGEIKIIKTYFCDIKPCNDCRYCWSHPACAIKDEMTSIFQYINQADNIVIASPIYFSELTGSLLQFASRLQYLWVSKNKRREAVLSEKPHNGIILLSGGGDGSADKALSTAKTLLKLMGAEFSGSVISHNTDAVPAVNDEKAKEEIKQIAAMLNMQVK